MTIKINKNNLNCLKNKSSLCLIFEMIRLHTAINLLRNDDFLNSNLDSYYNLRNLLSKKKKEIKIRFQLYTI